uniref:Putative estrogen receptor-related receptor n=1 Tax=Tabanus bromius TaxID=304241 RepID=A0A0K8TSL8_TABBR
MMTDGSVNRVKQEIETSCCSPTPSSGQSQSMVYNHSQASPGSPDRQFCSSTTTTLGEICGDSKSSLKEELPRRLCLVCGDTASGFHYGVASCEACKAFFKRTIQGNIEYTCPANNECEINKRRRKACQACRFQKCLVMGMLKEGVRLDRVRGGRQKYRRNPVSHPYQMQVLYPMPNVTATSTEDIKLVEILSTAETDMMTVGHVGVDLAGKDDKSGLFDEKTGTYDDKNTVFDDKNKVNSNVQEMLSILNEIYDQELVHVIGWAKQIPGFPDLPLNDQMRLLQATWAEILTLQLVYRSIPYFGKLVFATDFWLNERTAKECGALEFFAHCEQIADRLERLSLKKEEYYLLKALTLSNSDIPVEDGFLYRKLRDSIFSALNDCVYLTRHNSPTNPLAYQQQLLLVLPSLRQADQMVRKIWTNIYHEGNVTLNKLFVEMLELVPAK